MNEQNPAQAQNHSLSFTKLTAMIIGSTIGGGIFTTAGDMAASGAHTGSVLIGWAICGIGMFCLMMCFFGLNRVRLRGLTGDLTEIFPGDQHLAARIFGDAFCDAHHKAAHEDRRSCRTSPQSASAAGRSS